METTKTSLVRVDLNKFLPFILDHPKEMKRLTKEGRSLSSLHSYMPSHSRLLTLAVESDHTWTTYDDPQAILIWFWSRDLKKAFQGRSTEKKDLWPWGMQCLQLREISLGQCEEQLQWPHIALSSLLWTSKCYFAFSVLFVCPFSGWKLCGC